MKHINKFRLLIVFVFIIILLIIINVEHLKTEKISDEKVKPMNLVMVDSPDLIVGHDKSYPPYSQIDEGELSGFAVELSHYVANDMGYRVVDVTGSWHDMVEGLKNDEIDLISSMCINDDRLEEYHFSMTTFITKGEIFSLHGKEVKTLEDMTQVAVVKDGAVCDYLVSNYDFEIMTVNSTPEALALLEKGLVDYTALMEDVAYYYIDKYNMTTIVDNDLEFIQFENAFVSKDLTLVQQLNNSLQTIHREGIYQNLYDKWLGMTIEEPEFIKYLVSIVLLLMLILMLNISRVQRVFKKSSHISIKKNVDTMENIKLLPDSIFIYDKMNTLKFHQKNQAHHLNIKDMRKAIKQKEVKKMIRLLRNDRMIQSFQMNLSEDHYVVKMMIGHDEDIVFLCKYMKELKLEDRIAYLKTHDHLTGLYNRNYVYDVLDEVHSFKSVIVMDVNGLKIINDSFGHKKGDAILIAVANVIKEGVSEEHLTSRYDGDEFLILTDLIERSEINALIDKMKYGIQQIIVHNIFISVSFGWSLIEDGQVGEAISVAQNKLSKNKFYGSASFRSKIIETIMNTLHETNLREEAHSQRVSSYCASLGEAMGFSEEEINEIMTAGLLHDIGKVTIPEHILNKESKFTDEEYEVMKTHAIKGYSILSKIDDMLDIARYIKYHHERWDGKGYPHQLQGEQIPIQSRMITIADAFDAMISTRCYKVAMSEKEAIDELIRGKGKQFDPMLTDLFITRVLQQDHPSIVESIN